MVSTNKERRAWGSGKRLGGPEVGGANRLTNGHTAEELEVEAIDLGVKLAREKGWYRIIMESNSGKVINQIQGNIHHWRIETICGNIRRQVEAMDRVK